jgi:outer membrane lipoprotein-sorting protein
VAALIAVLAILMVPWSRPLSAMERMAQQLRKVDSYRYHLSQSTTRSVAPGHQITWSEEGDVFWQAPDAFRFEDRIVKREKLLPVSGRSEEPSEPELLEHFVEVFPANKPGLLIDHKRKTFLREGFEPLGSTTYPWQPLKMIREGQGRIIRDLGTREIAGKPARGYVTRLVSGDPPRSHDWHVWVDPATDLPLEIGYTVDDKKEPRTTTVLRVADFQWNLPLEAALFDASTPDGYREITSVPDAPQ